MDVQHFKDALLKKRTEILGTGGIKPLQASMENNTRQGDMADQAGGNNEVHIQLKLKQTDAKTLQATEEALGRIDKGPYGICRDCGEPIAPARLNAIPWTRVCITCKEKQTAEAPPSCSSCGRSFIGTRRRSTRGTPPPPASSRTTTSTTRTST